MAKAEEGGDIYSSYNFTGGRGTPKPYEPATSCPEDVFENKLCDARPSRTKAAVARARVVGLRVGRPVWQQQDERC